MSDPWPLWLSNFETVNWGTEPVLSLIMFCFSLQLKLQSDIATFTSSAKKSRNQAVVFVDETPSPYLTEWRILNFNPQIRIETEGLPVPVSK